MRFSPGSTFDESQLIDPCFWFPVRTETYHTYSYTPIRDETGKIRGLLNRSFECVICPIRIDASREGQD